ncbi:UDP-glucuronosyltransferase 3A1-like [Anomaloglossus baeobatrachus]|uniref:UDP-glucuronosyltransferase 3A1-like n=1 Tax=Anomaloglossus baeobatrachus TaxID=238106 RepID=UPI003F4F613F
MAMAGAQRPLILLLFLQVPLLQAARILTLCFVGGSHYLLMDKISRILHNNGHEVRMFLQFGDGMLPDHVLRQSPYPVSSYSLGEKYKQEFRDLFVESQKKYLKGRYDLDAFMVFMGQLSYQCNITLHQADILNFLKEGKYDLAVIEGFNPCSFLVADRLGVPYIAFFPGIFMNAGRVGAHGPLSYVPLFQSRLTDRMDFFDRVKNTVMYAGSYMVDRMIDASFQKVIDEHFPAGSRPSIADLQLDAELWIYNVDFTIEFPRPLLPNIKCIGGLLAGPAKPVSADLEAFISDSGDSGFIVVTLGSMISSLPVMEFLKEMNGGFAQMRQKVIWRYERSRWPIDVEVAPNIRLVDWLSQNDLLGHPKVRLLVTHGGMNSLMEAVYHGVPVLGIPLFGDQNENLIRIKAKNMGTFIPPEEMEAEKFANTMRRVIEDSRYKTTAMKQSVILRSRPLPPDRELLGWVEHIIQCGGGGHLRPYSYQQPWYQQHLLDVLLFIATIVVVILYLIVKVVRLLISFLSPNRKQKVN